jgi:hypothetical protein
MIAIAYGTPLFNNRDLVDRSHICDPLRQVALVIGRTLATECVIDRMVIKDDLRRR